MRNPLHKRCINNLRVVRLSFQGITLLPLSELGHTVTNTNIMVLKMPQGLMTNSVSFDDKLFDSIITRLEILDKHKKITLRIYL